MSDSKEKKEVKDSNELLNIFLMVIGGLFIFQGIVYYVEAYFPGAFGFMPIEVMNIINGDGPGTETFQALLGDSALIRLVMGAWAFIAGVGMFQEQEWAWGMAIVVMSMILVTTGGAVISAFINFSTISWVSWTWYIQLISVVFSALGILWLLGTKERYH
jgi:hypothetical protein